MLIVFFLGKNEKWVKFVINLITGNKLHFLCFVAVVNVYNY